MLYINENPNVFLFMTINIKLYIKVSGNNIII